LLIAKNKLLKTTTAQVNLYGWSAGTHDEQGSVHPDHDDHYFYKLNIYPCCDASQYVVTSLIYVLNKTRACVKSMVNLVALVKPLISIPILVEAMVQIDHLILGEYLND
jgi:hypothetical protein